MVNEISHDYTNWAIDQHDHDVITTSSLASVPEVPEYKIDR